MEVVGRDESVDAGERQPRQPLPLGVPRDPQPIPTPGVGDVRHFLDARDEHQLGVASLDGADPGAEGVPAGRAGVLHARRGDTDSRGLLQEHRRRVADLPSTETERRQERLAEGPALDPLVDAREGSIDGAPEQGPRAVLQRAEPGVTGADNRRSMRHFVPPANRLMNGLPRAS